jgi:hypothetical protein
MPLTCQPCSSPQAPAVSRNAGHRQTQCTLSLRDVGMSCEHIVRDGEYLSSIAAEYGFSNYTSIWLHPENAELKAKRKNPNVLLPGDKLYIPDRETKTMSVSTGKLHKFQLSASPVRLRIVIRDENGEPLANAVFRLTIEGNTTTVTTDGSGLLVQEIAPTSHSGTLILEQDGSPTDMEVALKIGFLHPVEDISGIQARLNNLGYNAGAIGAADEAGIRSAIEEFQCDNGLPPDGTCSEALQAKLKEIHGC